MAETPERPAGTLESSSPDSDGEPGVELRENPRVFTRWQRFQIFVAAWLGTFALSLVGRTLRWEISGWENWEAARKAGKGLIYTVWHREIFSATWFWRKRGIVVMTSQNFDGEYIARIIQKLGYGAARGSSSRGSVRALVEMRKAMGSGRDGGFTIDGPRGPRFVAKPGSVILAKATGAAILCFHAAVRRAFVFRKSWDQTQFPYPFSRAAMLIAPPIFVSPEADENEQARKLQEVQAALDGLRVRGDDWARSRKQN
jgi:lysophospholipid acyltransferase (LPLAT)-like uncharacterized protein